jgi:signal transduction histidine kinase
MKIRARLLTGFGFVTLAILTVVAFCLNNTETICDLFGELTNDTIPSTIAMSNMDGYAQQIYLLTSSQVTSEGFDKHQLQSIVQKLEKAGAKHLKNMSDSGSVREITAKELLRKIRAVSAAAMEIAGLKEQGATTTELTAKVGNEFQPLIWKLLDQINENKAVYAEQLTTAKESAQRAHIYGFPYALFASASAVLLAVGVALAVTRSIVEPLRILQNGARMIGRGNLNYKVGTDAKDEIGELSRAFDKMSENLKKSTTSTKVLNVVKEHANDIEQQLQAAKEQLQYEVAERKRVEEALEISKAEFRDFVHTASHDLRSPLRKIISFGALINESLEGKLEGEDKENLEFVINGAKKMSQMIEDLVVYSRMNTEESEFETLDLNEIVEQLKQSELADLIEQTGTTIEIPDDLLRVYANPDLAKLLLQNLLINAIQYRREDRRPQILMRSRESTQDTVRIEVQDNGVGIDKKHFSQIFKMFIRLHSGDERTGAGLAICEKIVEMHGGQIGVDSQMGEGATFWFTLPASKSPQQEQRELVSSTEIQTEA